jgi:hypothetical protein
MKKIIKLFSIILAVFALSSCETNYGISPFSIKTTSVKSLDGVVYFKAESNCVASIVEKGFCVSMSPNPTLSDMVYVAEKSDLSEYYVYPQSYKYNYSGYRFSYKNSYDNEYDYGNYYYDSNIKSFSTSAKDLFVGPRYYVRAYAISANNNVVYSNEYYFTVEK